MINRMLTKQQKQSYRAELFKHLDGIVTAPTVTSLYENKVIEFLSKLKDPVEINEISSKFNTNPGYLNVALRILSSQGWLNYKVDNKKNTITLSRNNNTVKLNEFAHLYIPVKNFLKKTEKTGLAALNKEIVNTLIQNFTEFQKAGSEFENINPSNQKVYYQILKHLEGMIVGPLIVILGQGGMFHKYFMEASFKPEEYHKEAKIFEEALNILTKLSWFSKINDTYSFTEKGLFFAKRASAYGVTVSYIPTLRNLDQLIFGDHLPLRTLEPNKPEPHVYREMNVWGSGGAHAIYFKKIDEIILSIFNKEPVAEQPKGILDMGCGNGAFLIHLYNLIEKQTLRGKNLDEYPLFLIGADYNQAALKVTRANMIQADIWAKVIWGDISDPIQLEQTLKNDYNIKLKELLNVRTFLDHNRIWKQPKEEPTFISKSTGAFAFKGKTLNNNEVEQNLTEHLSLWKPYVEKFGLLVIELHTTPPDLTARNLGKTAATAYDATHGYSDQYIVEIDVFEQAAERAGLYINKESFAKFPDSELATISICLLKGS
ncbi:N-6 DNA Methylase [Zhouia amylolytica]|uniref:N-6 DNA Methylase n=2 Tax=Zhouia amylolytica TaxID=376730 RepID=A0A1I6UYY0_9FLAO|nr:N-6 DNA Methylase [Zhouia amylolytica]